MDNELLRRATGQVAGPTSRAGRQLNRDAAEALAAAQLADLELMLVAKLTTNTMNYVVEMDDHRRMLAGGDEFRNRLLGQVEEVGMRGSLGILGSYAKGRY